MTNEDMERAIDFLLKSQANLEARIEQGNTNLRANIEQSNTNLRASIEQSNKNLGESIAQTNRILGEYADTLTDFIRVMTSTWEAQGLFNNSMRTAYRKLAEKVDKLKDTTGGPGGE